MTLRGELTADSSVFKETTFTVDVGDPCPNTSLYPIDTILDLETSVLLASGAVTRQVNPVQDVVSVAYGDSTGT